MQRPPGRRTPHGLSCYNTAAIYAGTAAQAHHSTKARRLNRVRQLGATAAYPCTVCQGISVHWMVGPPSSYVHVHHSCTCTSPPDQTNNATTCPAKAMGQAVHCVM